MGWCEIAGRKMLSIFIPKIGKSQYRNPKAYKPSHSYRQIAPKFFTVGYVMQFVNIGVDLSLGCVE